MPAEVEQGIAGVRVADGRLIFVKGTPTDLPTGTAIRLVESGSEIAGTVSVPPKLVLWCDPTVECARFLRLDAQQERLQTVMSDRDAANTLLAQDSAPDPQTLAAMLVLAREDLSRLDDA